MVVDMIPSYYYYCVFITSMEEGIIAVVSLNTKSEYAKLVCTRIVIENFILLTFGKFSSPNRTVKSIGNCRVYLDVGYLLVLKNFSLLHNMTIVKK